MSLLAQSVYFQMITCAACPVIVTQTHRNVQSAPLIPTAPEITNALMTNALTFLGKRAQLALTPISVQEESA